MTFEELKNYHNLVNEAWLKVPMNGNAGDFACSGMYCYNKAVEEFLNAGRTYYSNDNLTMDELNKLFYAELYGEQEPNPVIIDNNAIVVPHFADEECKRYNISKEDAEQIVSSIRGFASQMYEEKLNNTLLDASDDFPENAMIYNRNKKTN